MKILVVAPHPDDEVLGVGGTLARLISEGAEAYVVVLTKGMPPEFPEDLYKIARQEAKAANDILGVKEVFFLDLPAARLDTVPHREMNIQLSQVYKKVLPDILFIPFVGDIHMDHQLAFLSGMVVGRPNGPHAPKYIYAYETLSETNWNAPYITANFVPNVFIDISEYLETKIQAMEKYASQIKPFPNERSAEALRALATVRGSTVGRFAAEAFYLIRNIL